MVENLEISDHEIAKVSAVTCKGKNNSFVGRIDKDHREITKNQFYCEFEGSDKDSKYIDTIVVDGNVRYEKNLDHGNDVSSQEIEISTKGEPLSVRKADKQPNILVVSTQSAMEQENREKGEIDTPGRKELLKSEKVKKDQVVSKMACQTSQESVISIPETDCLITTKDGEIEEAGGIHRIEASGDMEIIDSGKNRDVRITPRNSIMEADSEIVVDDEKERTKLKLEDRRDKIKRGEK